MKLFVLLAVAALVVAVVESQDPVRLGPVVINGTSPGSCPSSSVLDAARMNSAAEVEQLFMNASCGGLGWTQIASLDLGDTSQQCPSPWVVSANPQRSCTSDPDGRNCPGVTFPGPGAAYNRVCGRILGYSVNTPDAFFGGAPTIDAPYLDGVSVTYGSPRQHIWSLAAGHGSSFGAQNNRCPCVNPDRIAAPLPPAFVGNNFFCDNLDNGGELWDAMECTNACCTFNSPPVFSVTLPVPTSDGIEVRMCHNQVSTDESVHIRFLELYVQ